MPAQSQQQESRNRYPGIKPFTSGERELFFGRDKDIEQFYSLLFIKQTVVLYGKSGYGKSSMLNAGVIPRLEEEKEWRCYTVRFNNFSERDTTDNVSPVENIKWRLSNGLSREDTAIMEKVIPGDDSLWYYVKSLQIAQHCSEFILFFDQFEELFTYPRAQIEDFSEQLSQLLYNTIPVKFRKRIAEMDESGEISDDLHGQLFEKPAVKVVFAIRSDRLALLNGLTDRHPAILQNHYELDALTRAEAAEAIVNPANQPQTQGYATPPFTYDQGAIEKILDGIANVQDGKIETSTLQIVCRYIEEELVGRKRSTCITADQLGAMSDIFRQYYEGVLSRLRDADREKVQRLIEDELIEDGHRNTLSEGYICNRFGFDPSLLRQLEQTSLLRKERDAAGRILFEISHDTLVAAIEVVAKTRRQRESEQRHRQQLAVEEEKQQKLRATLAEEQEKARMLQELNTNLSNLNQQVARRSRQAIALAVVSLLVAGVAGYLWYYSKQEERNVKVVLFRINLQKAREWEEPIKTYLASRDYELASRNLKVVDSLLTVVKVNLPPADESERQALLSAVENDKSMYRQK